MMQFRLHIDIPLGTDEEEASKRANYFMNFCFTDVDQKEKMQKLFHIDQLNYRLGHDEDRQKSNYLNKTESGHVTNKKIRLTLSD